MKYLYLSVTISLLLTSIIDFYGTSNLKLISDANGDAKSANPLFGTVCSDQTQPDIIVDFLITINGTIPVTLPPICLISPDSGLNINRNLTGNDERNIIYGREGLDVLEGRGGNDILDGGNDNDEIYGDDGDDVLYGSFGDDVLFGGNNNDMLVGSIGNDFLSGDKGADELYGDIGNDVLRGGQGPDFFDCGEDIDTVLDFNSKEGDVLAGTCETVSTKT
jgi:Ca2+-binding RTX toxin-like protein